MDKFLTVSKTEHKGILRTSKNQFKYNPYPIPEAKRRQVEAWRDLKKTEKILAPLREEKKTPTTTNPKALTRLLLNTLKDEGNPITHSSSGQLSDHVDSCVTGHQRTDHRRFSGVFTSRRRKLEEQRQEKGVDVNGVLKGVKVYVGGYMAGTTDIEMKRIVTLAGGKVMDTAAGATHILTSRGLSGSKTHKHLHAAARNKVHVVTPEWVLDSIAAGKRKAEWDYIVIKDTTVHEDAGVGHSFANQD